MRQVNTSISTTTFGCSVHSAPSSLKCLGNAGVHVTIDCGNFYCELKCCMTFRWTIWMPCGNLDSAGASSEAPPYLFSWMYWWIFPIKAYCPRIAVQYSDPFNSASSLTLTISKCFSSPVSRYMVNAMEYVWWRREYLCWVSSQQPPSTQSSQYSAGK